jgi:hypothetical protein
MMAGKPSQDSERPPEQSAAARRALFMRLNTLRWILNNLADVYSRRAF